MQYQLTSAQFNSIFNHQLSYGIQKFMSEEEGSRTIKWLSIDRNIYLCQFMIVEGDLLEEPERYSKITKQFLQDNGWERRWVRCMLASSYILDTEKKERDYELFYNDVAKLDVFADVKPEGPYLSTSEERVEPDSQLTLTKTAMLKGKLEQSTLIDYPRELSDNSWSKVSSLSKANDVIVDRLLTLLDFQLKLRYDEVDTDSFRKTLINQDFPNVNSLVIDENARRIQLKKEQTWSALFL